MTKETNYQIEDFIGTVHLKAWLRDGDGRQWINIHGRCTVVRDVDLVGFEVKGTESNWAVRVAGPKRDVITILGCQILAVTAHSAAPSDDELVDTWVVK